MYMGFYENTILAALDKEPKHPMVHRYQQMNVVLIILTHTQFNIRYSLGSLDPFLIEFKGHKRFWQLSKIRLQSPWA